MTTGTTSRFTEAYCAYAGEFTDAPKQFHRFMAYFLISMAVRRSVYIVQGHKRIFPNLWMVLLAPSSLFHKSYALSIAEDILRSSIPDITLPNEWSHESLLEGLQEKPEGVMFYDEFASLLAHLNRDYAAPARALLTSLYSCNETYERKTGTAVKRNFIVKDTFINIAAASTISWLKREAKADSLEGGFLPRFLFIAETERQTPIAFQPPADSTKRNTLVSRLAILSSEAKINFVRGATYNADALALFESFYVEFISSAMLKNERLHPFVTRLVTYLHKLALIISVDRGEYPKITQGAFIEARETVKYLARRFESVLVDELGVGEFGRVASRVERCIRNSGELGISRRDVMRKADVSCEWLDKIVKNLLERENISVHVGDKNRVFYRIIENSEDNENQHFSISK